MGYIIDLDNPRGGASPSGGPAGGSPFTGINLTEGINVHTHNLNAQVIEVKCYLSTGEELPISNWVKTSNNITTFDIAGDYTNVTLYYITISL